MKTRNLNGQCLGMPYDLRPPTIARLKSRVWNPDGPMFSPRVWGWGYTLNFAHRGAWVVATAATALVLTAVLG